MNGFSKINKSKPKLQLSGTTVLSVNKIGINEVGIDLIRKMTSEALFAGKRIIVIQHAGEKYQLRLTNQNKLILTK